MRAALSERDLTRLENETSVPNQPGTRTTSLDALSRQVLENLANRILPKSRIVRLTSFNKSADKNWALPWHQDRVIAVKQRENIEGFENWSRKDHYWHCEPPIGFLEDMVFSRIYFDDTDVTSGDLHIACRSHAYGKISAKQIPGIISASKIELCQAARGDVLFVKALTLHTSPLSKTTHSRKILRADFSARNLPPSLEWAL